MNRTYLKSLACLAAASVLALGSPPSLPNLRAAAESGSCGDSATWEFSSDGTLTISGSGDASTPNWYSVRESIKKVVIESGITAVSAYSAFQLCENLTAVEMADTVTEVGRNFCAECAQLQSVRLSENLTAIPLQCFLNCASLPVLQIPQTVQSIGSEAFYGCLSLSSVKFPSGLETIDSRAFYATNLTSVTFEEGITSIGASAFELCTLPSVTIPDSVTSIGEKAFYRVYSRIEKQDGRLQGVYSSDSPLCKICGSEGSAAQQFAQTYGHPFELVNGNTQHEHTYSDWTVTKEATCAEPGERSRSCTVCGETETEEIPATGEHTFSDWTVTKEATCSEPGERTRSCTVCGQTETEEIPATGEHSWSEWEIGETQKTRHCTVCGAEQTAPLDDAGRVCDGITVEVLQAAYFATDSFAPEQFRVTALITENGEQTSLDISADMTFAETPAQLAANGQGKASVHLRYVGSDAAVSAYTQNLEVLAEITIVLMGDPDADSVITIDDATAALQVYTNEALGIPGGMAPEAFYAADVIQDGVMTIDDAQVILAYYTYEALGMRPTWEELIG